jgi:hypothetical protein
MSWSLQAQRHSRAGAADVSTPELRQRRSADAADLPRTLLHAILAAFSSAASADRSAWCSAIAVSYGP